MAEINFSSATSFIPPIISTTSANPISTLDFHSLQITLDKLNGTNFHEWFQYVLLIMKGKGKVGYLMDVIPIPHLTAVNYSILDAKNSIIIAWLINFMKIKI